jgi:hypothetical protein
LKKKTNQRNSHYNTTYVSEPPEKLQRTFMGRRDHMADKMMKYMEWHTQYMEQSNN